MLLEKTDISLQTTIIIARALIGVVFLIRGLKSLQSFSGIFATPALTGRRKSVSNKKLNADNHSIWVTITLWEVRIQDRIRCQICQSIWYPGDLLRLPATHKLTNGPFEWEWRRDDIFIKEAKLRIRGSPGVIFHYYLIQESEEDMILRRASLSCSMPMDPRVFRVLASILAS